MHSEIIPGDGVVLVGAKQSSSGTVATVAPFGTWIDRDLRTILSTLGLESTPALALHAGTAPELIETAVLLLLMQQQPQPFVHSDNYGTLMQELLMVLSDSAARRRMK